MRFNLTITAFEKVTSDEEAVFEHYVKKIIDLVITGLNMPKLDGIGVINRVGIVKQYKFTPFSCLLLNLKLLKKWKPKK